MIARAIYRRVHVDYLEARGRSSVRILRAPLEEMGWERDMLEELEEERREGLGRLMDMCGEWKLCLVVGGVV